MRVPTSYTGSTVTFVEFGIEIVPIWVLPTDNDATSILVLSSKLLHESYISDLLAFALSLSSRSVISAIACVWSVLAFSSSLFLRSVISSSLSSRSVILEIDIFALPFSSACSLLTLLTICVCVLFSSSYKYN
jgi:hypothetical protein